MPLPSIAKWFQALLTPLPGFFSKFPSRYYSAIGVGRCLALAGLAAIFERRNQAALLVCEIATPVWCYGAITLYDNVFERFRILRRRRTPPHMSP